MDISIYRETDGELPRGKGVCLEMCIRTPLMWSVRYASVLNRLKGVLRRGREKMTTKRAGGRHGTRSPEDSHGEIAFVREKGRWLDG